MGPTCEPPNSHSVQQDLHKHEDKSFAGRCDLTSVPFYQNGNDTNGCDVNEQQKRSTAENSSTVSGGGCDLESAANSSGQVAPPVGGVNRLLLNGVPLCSVCGVSCCVGCNNSSGSGSVVVPDIVVSASPRFARKKDFKAAGRARSEQRRLSKKLTDPLEISICGETGQPRVQVSQSLSSPGGGGWRLGGESPEPTESTETIDRQMMDNSADSAQTVVEIKEDSVAEHSAPVVALLQAHQSANTSSTHNQVAAMESKEDHADVVMEAAALHEVTMMEAAQDAQQEVITSEMESSEQSQVLEEVSREIVVSESHESETASSFVAESVEIEEPTFIRKEQYVCGEKTFEQAIHESSATSYETSSEMASFGSTSIRKPSSLPLDQGDGSAMWSPRNTVISGEGRASGLSGDLDSDAVNSPTESVSREFLLQKRTSLAHTPDIVRVFDREIKQEHQVHEFQKVKNELRHVDEQTLNELRQCRSGQQSPEFASLQLQEVKELQEGYADSVNVEANKSITRSVSKQMIVDLSPEPIHLESEKQAGKGGKAGGGAAKTKAALQKKTTSLAKTTSSVGSSDAKKQSQTKTGKTTSKSNGKITGSSGAKTTANQLTKTRNGGQEKQQLAEYMQLNMEQIQRLATMQQQEGEIITAANVSSLMAASSTTIATTTTQQSNMECAMHTTESSTVTQSSATAVSKQKKTFNKKSGNQISGASGAKAALRKGSGGSENGSGQQDTEASKKSTVKKTSGDRSGAGSLKSPNLIQNVKGTGSNNGITNGTCKGKDGKKQEKATDSKIKQAEAGNKKETLESPSLIQDLSGADMKGSKPADDNSDGSQNGRKSSNSPTRKASDRQPVITLTNGDRKDSAESTGSNASATKGGKISNKRQADSKKEVNNRGGKAYHSVNGKLSRDNSKLSRDGSSRLSSARHSPAPPPPHVKTSGAATEPNVHGGFLAPTQSWLSHMGEKLEYKSRSPSPRRREGKISTTVPRKPLDRSRSPCCHNHGDHTGEAHEHHRHSRPSDKPAVPSTGGTKKPTQSGAKKTDTGTGVKRTSSLRVTRTAGGSSRGTSNGGAGGVPAAAGLKRSGSLKKPLGQSSNGEEKKEKPLLVPRSLEEKLKTGKSVRAASGKPAAKAQASAGGPKPAVNVPTDALSASGGKAKKDPPPVPPKPDKSKMIGNDGTNRMEDGTLNETATGRGVFSSTAGLELSRSAKLIGDSVTTSESTCAFEGTETYVSEAEAVLSRSAVTASSEAETSNTSSATTKTTEESGIEETSISATSVIKKFETAATMEQSTSSSTTTSASIRGNILQDTVSSRMKKVSATELSQQTVTGESSLTQEQMSLDQESRTDKKESQVSKKSSFTESDKQVTKKQQQQQNKSSSASASASKSTASSSNATATSAKTSRVSTSSINANSSVVSSSAVTSSSSSTAKTAATAASNASNTVVTTAKTIVTSGNKESVGQTKTARMSTTARSTDSSSLREASEAENSSSITNNNNKANTTTTTTVSSIKKTSVGKSSSSVTSGASTTLTAIKQTSSSSRQQSASNNSSTTTTTTILTTTTTGNSGGRQQSNTGNQQQRSYSSSVSRAINTGESRGRSRSQGGAEAARQHTLLDTKSTSGTNISAGESQYKTTMVVRLHPGQSRRLSACVDKQMPAEGCSEKTWLAEVENTVTSTAVCGLEISFQSVPQAIDIRLINGQGEVIPTQEFPGGVAKSEQSISSETIAIEPDKTRQ